MDYNSYTSALECAKITDSHFLYLPVAHMVYNPDRTFLKEQQIKGLNKLKSKEEE